MNNVQKRIDELIQIINQCNYEYYNLANPSLTDQEYDNYMNELIFLENKYPELLKKDSPTQRVGTKILDKFSKVRHQIPMLSLGNVFNEEEILAFDERIKKQGINPRYVCELKIDGLSVSLRYEHGLLVKGATRGDGEVGEDITENVKTIRDIPLRINKDIDIEVRGEIYLNKENFNKLNLEKEKLNEPLFQNARNAAAGSIRNLDSKIAAKRNLSCFIYHLPNPQDYHITNHHEALAFMKELGFVVNSNNQLVNNVTEVINYVEGASQKRETLPYDIDGVVIKLDSINSQEKMGYTAKTPKWATAYKFPAMEAITKLQKIFYTVGRTGKITPNAMLEPVKLMGSTISFATLHNIDNITNRDIREGDYIRIRKAGDVIPYIIGPVLEKRIDNLPKAVMIDKCPICHTNLVKLESGVDYYCPNNLCDARRMEKIIHYASKDAMDIEGLGEAVVEDFYNLGYLKDISNIYNLAMHTDSLKMLEGYGDKSINNLLESINNSKNNSLEKLLFALGIKEVGKKTAKILAKHYQNLDNIIKATIDDLLKIKDIGEIVSLSISNYFKDEENILLINKLKNYQVNTKYFGSSDNNLIFKDQVFVLTGTLPNLKREEATKMIEDRGGIITNAVSKKTNVLLKGDNPGSKYDKAKELGIQIWEEADLVKNINK